LAGEKTRPLHLLADSELEVLFNLVIVTAELGGGRRARALPLGGPTASEGAPGKPGPHTRTYQICEKLGWDLGIPAPKTRLDIDGEELHNSMACLSQA
jgi:hypothetical protein